MAPCGCTSPPGMHRKEATSLGNGDEGMRKGEKVRSRGQPRKWGITVPGVKTAVPKKETSMTKGGEENLQQQRRDEKLRRGGHKKRAGGDTNHKKKQKKKKTTTI